MNETTAAPARLFASVWADLLKAFWDERGNGARYRTVRVGVDYLAGLLPDRPAGRQAALDQTVALVEQTGIAESVSYDVRHDFADSAELKVRGCVFHAGELALQAKGCQPYACITANLAMHLVETPDSSPELARVDVNEEGCAVQIVFFEMPKDL